MNSNPRLTTSAASESKQSAPTRPASDRRSSLSRFSRLAPHFSSLAILAITITALAAPDALPARLRVAAPPATTQSSVAPARPIRTFVPRLDVARAPRALDPAPATTQPAPIDRPPLLALSAAPAHSQFAQGPRLLATPPPPLVPYIPNLLVSSRKAARAVLNPIITPAAPVSTPAVNNTDGTAVLAPLSYFTREIQVEIATPATPLSFEQSPYLQSPVAPDDQDAPAGSKPPKLPPLK